jgi:hypothetical protein
MLRHQGVPLPRHRLEELAHGMAGGSGGRAVDTRIHRLREKLEPDPANPRVLRTVRGEGYLLVPGPGEDALVPCRPWFDGLAAQFRRTGLIPAGRWRWRRDTGSR